MPTIIWEGNQKEFGVSHPSHPIPKGAVQLRSSEGFMTSAIPYGIAPMIICMIAVFWKAFMHSESPIDPLFLLPALLIGLFNALVFHEFMHAIFYPDEATVWVGLCLRKLEAYAISYDPLTRNRFIGMSLAPVIPGLIFLLMFICVPISMKPLLTVCIVSAIMGLISPAPDYMDVISVLKKAPRNALICDFQEGLYYYVP